VRDSVQSILDEYAEIEARLADPSLHADQNRVRTLNKRYSELGPVVAAARAWRAAVGDLAAGRELAEEEQAFATEVPALEAVLGTAEERLRRLLVPRDPDDDRNVILEI
jgi:peptide chain release factor 1